MFYPLLSFVSSCHFPLPLLSCSLFPLFLFQICPWSPSPIIPSSWCIVCLWQPTILTHLRHSQAHFVLWTPRWKETALICQNKSHWQGWNRSTIVSLWNYFSRYEQVWRLWGHETFHACKEPCQISVQDLRKGKKKSAIRQQWWVSSEAAAAGWCSVDRNKAVA